MSSMYIDLRMYGILFKARVFLTSLKRYSLVDRIGIAVARGLLVTVRTRM
jgi:hypothetical protein